MSKIWFTSDTHFGSMKTLIKAARPFKTTNSMDKEIIRNWNYLVKPGDTVYHCGDFGDYSILNKLNGEVILIMGNHERKEEMSVSQLLSYGFKEVYETDTIVNVEGNEFHLCHEPSKHDPNMFNLFGHIHNFQMVLAFGINVGVDCHHFRPIDLERILLFKRIKENGYKGEQFI
jgi:calcineurin-like phosphoesterase family protein